MLNVVTLAFLVVLGTCAILIPVMLYVFWLKPSGWAWCEAVGRKSHPLFTSRSTASGVLCENAAAAAVATGTCRERTAGLVPLRMQARALCPGAVETCLELNSMCTVTRTWCQSRREIRKVCV